MRHKVYITFFLALLTTSTFSQVNTEKYRKQIDEEGIYGIINLAAGLNSGNSEFVSVKGGLRLDYITEKADYFIVGNYEFKEGNDRKIVNKGFAHLRAIIELSSFIDIEAFLQKEFNQFILLNDRSLAGSGLRLNIIDDPERESPLSIFLGVGFMYEQEKLNTKPADSETNIFRSTNYLTINWRINESVEFLLIGYLQADARRFSDRRIITDASLNFRITENLLFNTSFNYRFDNEPVQSIKKYDLELVNGITFRF